MPKPRCRFCGEYLEEFRVFGDYWEYRCLNKNCQPKGSEYEKTDSNDFNVNATTGRGNAY